DVNTPERGGVCPVMERADRGRRWWPVAQGDSAAREVDEIAVFAKVEDAMVTFGLLASSRITGSGIVNFVGANSAQSNERGDAQRGSAKEYGALGKILAG